MVKLTCIYTKGGDKGKTSLGTGARRYKSDLIFEAIGSVDEANGALALAWQYSSLDIQDLLRHIQNDLFDVGADLCMPTSEKEALRIKQEQVTWLEEQIDKYNSNLLPLTSFVLPGGTIASTAFHLARCVVRRAERTLVALNLQETLNPTLISYLNRLSDLLFVLARYANHKGKEDVLWEPGRNQ